MMKFHNYYLWRKHVLNFISLERLDDTQKEICKRINRDQ